MDEEQQMDPGVVPDRIKEALDAASGLNDFPDLPKPLDDYMPKDVFEIDFPKLLQTLSEQDAQFKSLHIPGSMYPGKMGISAYGFDWNSLKETISLFPIRNKSMMAVMPREDQVIRIMDGTTPGIYPIRESLWDSPDMVAALQLNRSRPSKGNYYGVYQMLDRTKSALETSILGQKIIHATRDFEATPAEGDDPHWGVLKATIESLAPGEVTVDITPISTTPMNNQPDIDVHPDEDETGLERELVDADSEDDILGTEGGYILKLSNYKPTWDFVQDFQFTGEWNIDNEGVDTFEVEIYSKDDYNLLITQLLDECGLDAFPGKLAPRTLE